MSDSSGGPVTFERAATAIVRGRRRLEQAREEIRLALDVLARLDGSSAGRLRDAERSVVLSRLAEVVGRLEAAGRALGSAWRTGEPAR